MTNLNYFLKTLSGVLLILLSCLILFSAGYLKGKMNTHDYLRDVTIGYDEMCQEEGYGRMVVSRTIAPSGDDSTVHLSCERSHQFIYQEGECFEVKFGDNPLEYWCNKK